MKLVTSGLILAAGITIGVMGAIFAPHITSQLYQPYAGQNQRQISSLSASDIEQLEKGEGWGLAKPAEFNGFPGPAHILELGEQLGLDNTQRLNIQNSFDRMNLAARALGQELIESEVALDVAFKEKNISVDELERLLAATEAARSALRKVHLAAHLEVAPLLNDTQKSLYAELRGYGDGHSGHEGH